MADLIYTRRPDAQELSMEDIARLAPAAFTQTKSPDMTDRYAQVDTLRAIEILRGYGYVPVQAAQKRSRKEGSSKYAQHMIAFAHKWNLLDSDRPEIIAYNSHNGKSSLKLFGGFFRGICSNGLVAGDGYQGKLRHLHTTVSNFEDLIEDTAATLPKMSDRISRMKNVRLYSRDALDFAYNAMTLRWEMLPESHGEGHLRGAYADSYTGSSILTTRRVEDVRDDLWTVFNKVQENLIRGGAQVISFSDRNKYGKRRTARPVASVEESIRVNRGLWDMAEKLLEVAG